MSSCAVLSSVTANHTSMRGFTLRSCHLHASHRILQPSRTKLLIRLGKSLFLGSGKATTRAKRRITAALRVLDLRTASPRGHSEETVPLP